jgi:hypothetical protein
MKITFDCRKKGTKAHGAFINYAFKKAVKNRDAEVYIKDKMDLTLVAKNGVVGVER